MTSLWKQSIQINSIASFTGNLFLIAWFWGHCTFSNSFVVSLRSSPWPKYTKYETTFFFFKYVLYWTVLSKYLGKKSGVTLLVSSQTAVKGGHGFEIAVSMDNLRGGDWGVIQNNAHCVRSMHSRSSLFSVVFMWLISQHRSSKLKRVPRSEVSQDLMRFWSYESLFWTTL